MNTPDRARMRLVHAAAANEDATAPAFALDPQLAGVLYMLPVAAMVVDREGRVRLWNRAAQRLLGWREAEVLGRIVHLMPAEASQALRERLKGKDRAGAGARFTTLRLHKDGRRVPVHPSIRVLSGPEGKPIGVVRIFEGLAERQRAEEAMRRLLARHDSALEGERARIARELHDELGQALTALKMNLAWLARRSSARTSGKLADMRELIDQTMLGVRRLASELRPAQLDHGFFEALERQVRRFERLTRLTCTLDLPPQAPDPGPQAATVVYRVLQELLTNVARHAGATRVEVRLRRAGAYLELRVSDDGCGFDPAHIREGACGLVGMRERAALAGGEIDIATAPGTGTRATLHVPLA